MKIHIKAPLLLILAIFMSGLTVLAPPNDDQVLLVMVGGTNLNDFDCALRSHMYVAASHPQLVSCDVVRC